MKIDLYRHADGTITSIVNNETADGKISLQGNREEVFPRIQRTDPNGIILKKNDGNERISFIPVSDFFVLSYMYMEKNEVAIGCTELKNQVISFFGSREDVDVDTDQWTDVCAKIQGFTYANKFTGPNATIRRACDSIGDNDVFDTWLQRVHTRIALRSNCKDAGFQIPDMNMLLRLNTMQSLKMKEPFAERYIRIPDENTSFRTSSLVSLTELLDSGDQFVLKGKELTGKTTALKLITKTLSSDSSPYLPVFVDLQNTNLYEKYPIKGFLERTALNPDNNAQQESTKKKVILIIDSCELVELSDTIKDEIRSWKENGVKVLTTCSFEGAAVNCFLAPMTDNCLAEYLNFPNKNIHLPLYSPLRELPVLSLYKSLLNRCKISADSSEVTKWDVLNSYFSPDFSGTPLPAVGFFSVCMEGNDQQNILPAVDWYIKQSGNDEQKRALQGKYLFQWGAVTFIIQVLETGEFCIDDSRFKYTDRTPWGELLYESLSNASFVNILQNSYAGNEKYHQFVLKCLYTAFNSYIDSVRNEDKSKVKRCEEVKNTLYKIFQLEYEHIEAENTADKTVFLQIARLCGEVFRRCFQFEKVDSIKDRVFSLFTDDAEKEKYKLLLLSIENNTAKAKRARAVKMYEQQKNTGNKYLQLRTFSKDSKDYKEKKRLLDPAEMKRYMPCQNADMLRNLLFCCAENVHELGKNQYDCMLVLGSNSIEANCEQLISAVAAGHLKRKGKVILSGRYPDKQEGSGAKTEAERMRLYLTENLGEMNGLLTSDQIMLEEESTNAKENIVYSFEFIKEHGLAEIGHPYRVLIISKAFISYRVKMYLDYWVKDMDVEADYLGVTEPEGTGILHVAKKDFDKYPDSTARIYEEAMRLLKFSQYRTDGNMPDLFIPEETGKQLLKMLNHAAVYPEFFHVQRKGKSSPVLYNLYLPAENDLQKLLI